MVNLKTKAMVFSRRGVVNNRKKLYFEGEAIEEVNRYKNT